jgi:hypothetical protein
MAYIYQNLIENDRRSSYLRIAKNSVRKDGLSAFLDEPEGLESLIYIELFVIKNIGAVPKLSPDPTPDAAEEEVNILPESVGHKSRILPILIEHPEGRSEARKIMRIIGPLILVTHPLNEETFYLLPTLLRADHAVQGGHHRLRLQGRKNLVELSIFLRGFGGCRLQ